MIGWCMFIMSIGAIIQYLLNEDNYKSVDEARFIAPKRPGIYAIFIRNPKVLPNPFKDYVLQNSTQVIYVGKATDSIYKRLCNQDLQHAEGASTFFRSIGAVLGYKPPAGFLAYKKNKYNYRFTAEDNIRIVGWIKSNLFVNWYEIKNPEEFEAEVIKAFKPAINLNHNSAALSELRTLRDQCRGIALSYNE